MKVAVIGAGFTGLAAAFRLSQAGAQVTVLEKESQPGGLAIGFKDPNWDWPLEKHYHHIFTSDNAIRHLASEINHSISFSRPITSTYIDRKISQLDSPLSLLRFSGLSVMDRLRTAAALGFLKINPFWSPLENISAAHFLQTSMGKRAWSVLWEPLFEGKFGNFAGDISATWFWARIHKRSMSLGYPDGGFQSLADDLATSTKRLGAEFVFNAKVSSIAELQKGYDRIICTLPTPIFTQISGLNYPHLSGIGAVNLVLALKKPFFSNGTYWLNINDRRLPFLAVVEHTNFVDPAHYGGDNLIYVGNYLPSSHPYFSLSASELLTKFLPHLQTINPTFSHTDVRSAWVWKAPFAQPIVDLQYSQKIPPLTTAIPGLYLANIQQVYPWDRGTNYAVELGNKVAKLCITS